jgi:hypothetical protein
VYPFCARKAKQNYTDFNPSGKYSAHFSWDRREENFGLLKISFKYF